MLELLNIRFTFSLRTSHQNAEGKSAILLRVTFQKERRDVFTGLYCFEKDWDRTVGKVIKSDKNASAINENLAIILKGANNSFDEMRFSRESFTLGELIDKMKGKDVRPTLLIDYLKEGNAKMLKRVGTELSRPAYNKYNRSLKLQFAKTNTGVYREILSVPAI